MAQGFTVKEFFARFPDDDKCLEHLMRLRFGETIRCPKCEKQGHFVRLRKHPAYACPWCGHHIHPMVGTPFATSHTPLQKWFYAMYLFTTSRHGVPAKELQRQLGVTYKTAWRIGHEIRKYLAKVDDDTPLSGHVELDETLIGGRREGHENRNKGKSIVFGMLERDGEVMMRVVPNTRGKTLRPHIIENVERGSEISTDEATAYKRLAKFGYKHGAVSHRADEWVRGSTHVNSIEGFWSLLKRAIRGTHVHVSAKHLPKYLGEFEYRYNMRKSPALMFPRLLSGF